MKLAWTKAARGPKVDWIGAEYRVAKELQHVIVVDVTITQKKTKKLIERASASWNKRTVSAAR